MTKLRSQTAGCSSWARIRSTREIWAESCHLSCQTCLVVQNMFFIATCYIKEPAVILLNSQQRESKQISTWQSWNIASGEQRRKDYQEKHPSCLYKFILANLLITGFHVGASQEEKHSSTLHSTSKASRATVHTTWLNQHPIWGFILTAYELWHILSTVREQLQGDGQHVPSTQLCKGLAYFCFILAEPFGELTMALTCGYMCA